MVYLIDPKNLVKDGNGCKRKGCQIVCKLCTPLCPTKIVPMYGIPTPIEE